MKMKTSLNNKYISHLFWTFSKSITHFCRLFQALIVPLYLKYFFTTFFPVFSSVLLVLLIFSQSIHLLLLISFFKGPFFSFGFLHHNNRMIIDLSNQVKNELFLS